jgi:hypothetical protein
MSQIVVNIVYSEITAIIVMGCESNYTNNLFNVLEQKMMNETWTE